MAAPDRGILEISAARGDAVDNLHMAQTDTLLQVATGQSRIIKTLDIGANSSAVFTKADKLSTFYFMEMVLFLKQAASSNRSPTAKTGAFLNIAKAPVSDYCRGLRGQI